MRDQRGADDMLILAQQKRSLGEEKDMIRVRSSFERSRDETFCDIAMVE